MDGMAWPRECQVKGVSTGEMEVRAGADSSLGHWPGLQPFDFMSSKFIWPDFKRKKKKKKKEGRN